MFNITVGTNGGCKFGIVEVKEEFDGKFRAELVKTNLLQNPFILDVNLEKTTNGKNNVANILTLDVRSNSAKH